MTTNAALIALEVVAAVGLILWRQLSVRQIKDNLVRGPVIIGAIGLVNTTTYLKTHTARPGEVAAVVIGLVLSAVIAWPRARSMKLWRDADGTWLRRGTAMTLVWWLVLMVSHVAVSIGIPALLGEKVSGYSGLDSATIMIFLGVSLGAQGLFTELRLQRSFPGQRSGGVRLAR